MNRKNFYVLAFVLVAALPLIIFSEEKIANGMEYRSGIKMSGDSANGFVHRLMPLFRLADDINLTNPQLIQLRMLYQKNCQLDDEKMCRMELLKKLSDPSLKEEDVQKLAAEAAKQAEENILKRFRMMQEIKKILTPEQLSKLETCRMSHKGGRFMNGHRRGKIKGMHNFLSKGRKHMFHNRGEYPPPPPPIEEDEMTP